MARTHWYFDGIADDELGWHRLDEEGARRVVNRAWIRRMVVDGASVKRYRIAFAAWQ